MLVAGLKNEMLALALKSTKADMSEAAEYYESQRMIDKVIDVLEKDLMFI